MNQLKSNRKFLIFCFVYIIFCLNIFFTSCKGQKEDNYFNIKEVAKEKTVQEIKELHGIVKEAAMNTLIVTSKGKDYHFMTTDVDVTTEETGILIDNPVLVYYRGILKENSDGEEVEIVKIQVMDKKDIINEKSNENIDTQEVIKNKALEILDRMSIEEKVGQMFIARSPRSEAAEKVKEYNLGGYILFARDFADKKKDEIIANIENYQNAAKISMFIGVDEEGGTVNRVSKNRNLRAVPFWSPQALYETGGYTLIKSDTKEKCNLLKSLGINLNFSPVCDVSTDSKDFIYERSFGKNAEETSKYIELVVKTMKNENMGSVLKHFPGYGNNADTHMGIVYDKRSYESFEKYDFLPFKAGINAGASMVLVSHNVVNAMDEDNPASISPKIHDILRNELGFVGPIITDDLAMEGVRGFAKDGEIAVKAVEAGNDLLCSSNIEIQIPAVIEAVKDGKIKEKIIDEAVLRILKTKIKLGIIK